MRRCIDCGRRLNEDTRSLQQPALRCQRCFDSFSERVTRTLTDMRDELADQENDDANEH